MRKLTQRALAGLLAVLLVTTAAAPVGTASAKHECDAGDLTVGLYKTASYEVYDQAFGTDLSGGADSDGMLGCDLKHGSTEANLTDADQSEARNEIESAAATSAQHAENDVTWWENGIQGLEQQARSDGLAAYGRALENDSSQSAAKLEAEGQIDEFYAVRINNLVADWNTLTLSWQDYENQSGVNNLGAYAIVESSYQGDSITGGYASPNGEQSIALGNGSTATAHAIDNGWALSGTHVDTYSDVQLVIKDGYDGNYRVRSPHRHRYLNVLQTLRNQRENVTAEVNTWINQTYSEVQAGDITWSEAVGASTIARNFAAEGDIQSWALTRLSNMRGVSPPKNLSEVGYYEISHENETQKGLLASDGNPPSGAFEAGETYNGSKLSGPQYLIANDSVTDLDGLFTVESITDDRGEQINRTVIKEVSYETQNTSNLAALIESNQELRAQIEARQQRLRNNSGGSGGLFDFGSLGASLPYGGAGVMAALSAIVVLGLVTRN
jgi:hypothetical protein